MNFITLKKYDGKQYFCLHCLSHGVLTKLSFHEGLDHKEECPKCLWVNDLFDDAEDVPVIIRVIVDENYTTQNCYPSISLSEIEYLPPLTKEAFLQLLKNEIVIPGDVLEFIIDLYDRSLEKTSFEELKKGGYLNNPDIEKKLREIGYNDDQTEYDIEGLILELAKALDRHRNKKAILTQNQRMLLHKLCNKNTRKLQDKIKMYKAQINASVYLSSSGFCKKDLEPTD